MRKMQIDDTCSVLTRRHPQSILVFRTQTVTVQASQALKDSSSRRMKHSFQGLNIAFLH